MSEIKPTKGATKVKFQDLCIESLHEMHTWLEKNVPSKNYAIIPDLHVMLEHVNHQINPYKATLDFFQVIRKLEIPTANHAITIQSFDSALPKFFCKSKEHIVLKADDTLFENIKSFSEWDDPNYGYRTRFNDEVDNAEKAIQNAIQGDRSLSSEGKAVCINALTITRSFIDQLVRYIDITYRELRRSKYTEKRAWHLVTSLCCRIFTDVYEPRGGKLGIMESKDPNQVAITVFFACFQSLEVMREYKELGFAKHPSISSEYIKFICHNSPFETLELYDSRIKGVEASIKEANSKMASNAKQLNTTTQKAEEGKSKLSNLESRVAKLEKK